MAAASVPLIDTPPALHARRYVEAAAAVALWMSIGFGFHLGGNAYLLAGLPIVVAFQLFIAKRPLRAAWMRDGRPFRLGLAGSALAVLIAAWPCKELIESVRGHEGWLIYGWYACALFGAIGVAWTLLNFRRATVRELLVCFGYAGFCGVLVVVLSVMAMHGQHGLLLARLAVFGTSLLRYIPVVFVLEEVWFRGVLDSHVYRDGEARGIASAIFVSSLWGLWHLPLVPVTKPLMYLPIAFSLLCAHVPLGVFLSLSWRKSGNLFVPGVVHAFIDAVRNALMA